jgi:hypothetical protein
MYNFHIFNALSRVRITKTGFGLVIGFIDYLQIVTTSNFSAIANSHTLQFTTRHTKYFPACGVFTSRFLVTAFNSGSSSYSGFPNYPRTSATNF